MKEINFTTRRWAQKIVLALSLMLLFSAPLFAQGGGWNHHRNDSVPPPPPPPPPPHHHWNDSLPPPHWNDSIPPYWGDSTNRGNDSIPPPPPPHHKCDTIHWGSDSLRLHKWNDSVPPPHWNDSVPPPHKGDTARHWNDSIPPHWGDSLRHRLNDSTRFHGWNDSIPFDTIYHCGGGDSMGVAHTQIKASVTIYPNPIIETAKIHIANTSGTLTFNLYGQAGRLVLTLPNLTNGDVQLNNSGLTPGIYIYELRNSNSVVSTGRVVIQ